MKKYCKSKKPLGCASINGGPICLMEDILKKLNIKAKWDYSYGDYMFKFNDMEDGHKLTNYLEKKYNCEAYYQTNGKVDLIVRSTRNCNFYYD